MLCVVISFFLQIWCSEVFLKDLGDVDNLSVSLDISTFSEAHSKFDLFVIGEVQSCKSGTLVNLKLNNNTKGWTFNSQHSQLDFQAMFQQFLCLLVAWAMFEHNVGTI